MATVAPWADRHAQRKKSLVERFVEKYEVNPATGCWEWRAARFAGTSYGSFANRRAHRVAYELFNGSIEDGLVIDHLCGNGSCVNPAHLEAVTQEENRCRQQHRQTHCRRGHPLSGSNLALVRVCRTCRGETERRHVARKRGDS